VRAQVLVHSDARARLDTAYRSSWSSGPDARGGRVRVAFVTQWFPPEQGTVVPQSIARGLADRGHEVDVLTAFPNYPTGKLYPGWSQHLYRREDPQNGVTVHRSAVYPSHDGRVPHRVGSYLSHATTAALATPRLPQPDVWLVYSSPATAALPAQLAWPSRRAPVCLLIQDLWPDSVLDSGMLSGSTGRLAGALLNRYTQWSYRHARRIGVISPSMRDLLEERGVPRNKVHWTPNWLSQAPGDQWVRREDAPARERLRFLYAGNLGSLQALSALVEAFALVPEVDLVIMGDGVARASLESRAATVPNVTIAPSVPHEEVQAHLASADVLTISLADTPLLRATMPSKVQAYLRAGKPILAHAAGDVARLVDQHRVGLACPPGDPLRAAELIRRFVAAPRGELAEMGRRAGRVYETTFSQSVGVARLESMLLEALER
jgi:colanic acid biosynthesis glycosyl transferase WcaI